MKTKQMLPSACLVLAFTLVLQPSALVRAATTINSIDHYTYGVNIGWLDWRGDVNNGAVIGNKICLGYIYAANIGWITLGSGNPTNGVQYQNLSVNDFGVNVDSSGNLHGCAYGANIGWVNFEANGAAKIDLTSGNLSGYAYSANSGWISLSNAVAYVRSAVADTNMQPVLNRFVGGTQTTNVTVTCSAANGVTYQLQYKNELNEPTWSVLRNFTANDTTASITDPTSPVPYQRYYRIVIVP